VVVAVMPDGTPALASSPRAPRLAPQLRRLWAGILLAPVSWIADFLIRYMAIRFANVHDRRWPMVMSTAGGLVLLLVGAALCWRAWRTRTGEEKTLAAWGLGLALFFLILILGQAFPTWVISPREIA
jgi:hypothetical protein